MQQQPDRVFVLTQAHGVQHVEGGAGAALLPELRPQGGLQEVVPPDVSGEERDGERHHSAALQQRDGLLLRQLADQQTNKERRF